MALQALIFDVDGTLAETEEAHRESFNLAFKDFNLDWHWDPELYKELLKVTGGRERIKHFCTGWSPKGKEQFENYNKIIKLHTHKTSLYKTLIETGGISLRPGMEELLLEAKAAGKVLAISTTTGRENLDLLLTATLGEDSISWFKAISTGDRVTNKKPDPELFELAVKELGLPAAVCLAFEDSKPGLISAKGAGLKVLITASDYTADSQFDGALRVVNHLGTKDNPPKSLNGQTIEPKPITLKTLEHWFEQG